MSDVEASTETIPAIVDGQILPPVDPASRTEVEFTSDGLTLGGHLYRPPSVLADQPIAALAMAGPMTSVKEETLPHYAVELAKAGFAVLTFDNRNFGASQGSRPQHLSTSEQVEDLKSAISYLASAEGFFWISTTCLDLSSSLPNRSTSRLSRTIPRSRGSAFWRPAGLARVASAPSSRWRRQVVINEEYRPSRRSSAPRADRGKVSYSARTLALYLAENCRRPKERSGTSGARAAASSIAPAWCARGQGA